MDFRNSTALFGTFWGQNAAPGTITPEGIVPDVPSASLPERRATLSTGWPLITMLPPSQGGKAPDGRDGNAILSMLSKGMQSHEAGIRPPFSAAFAASIGGYPQGALLPDATKTGLYWRSTKDGNTSVPGSNADWAPVSLEGLNALLQDTPYYPRRLVAPPLVQGARPWMNDPQPPAEGGDGRFWTLDSPDADNPTVTSWREWLPDDTSSTGYRDNGLRVTPSQDGDWVDSIMTGSVIVLQKDATFSDAKTGTQTLPAGTWVYYLSLQNPKGQQGIEIWTASGPGVNPTRLTVLFPYVAGANRDPMVRSKADGSGYRMVRTTEAGLIWATSADGLAWSVAGQTQGLHDVFIGAYECCDFNETLGVICFGATFGDPDNLPSTSRTAYLFGHFENDVFVPDELPHDLRDCALDLGDAWYASRGLTGPCMGWMNNWNWAMNLPIPAFNGFLATPRTLAIGTSPQGRKILVPTPVERPWKHRVAVSSMQVEGQYSPFPFHNLPPAFRLDLELTCHSGTWPQHLPIQFDDGNVFGFTINLSPSGSTDRDGTPVAEITKNSFGAMPYTQTMDVWNDYFRVPLAKNAPVKLTVIVDRGSAEVFVNGQYACSMLVLWPVGSPVFWIDAVTAPRYYGGGATPVPTQIGPDGSAMPVANLTANVTLSFDEYPPPQEGSLTVRVGDGRYQRVNPWIVYTYDPNLPGGPEAGGKSIYQIVYLNSQYGKNGKLNRPGGFYVKYSADPNEDPTPIVPSSLLITSDGKGGLQNILDDIAALQKQQKQNTLDIAVNATAIQSTNDALTADVTRLTNAMQAVQTQLTDALAAQNKVIGNLTTQLTTLRAQVLGNGTVAQDESVREQMGQLGRR